MIGRNAGVAIALSLAAAPAAWAQPLMLRRAEPAPAGTVVELTPEGVVVDGETAAPVIVAWDRVLRIEGEQGDSDWRDTGDEVWRAWARLERGDALAAEPLFEDVLRAREGAQGPTTARAAEGLLRCRLDRGARTLALEAWLAWQHAAAPAPGPQPYQRRAGGQWGPVEDPRYALVTDLPPIWGDDDAVRAFASAPLPQEWTGRAGELAALYHAAACFATGLDADLPPRPSADRGAALVWDLVAAQSDDRGARTQAIVALEQVIEREQEGWVQAWAHVAIGRGLARDATPERRQLGALHLLRVPAQFEAIAPSLAALALRDAAGIMEQMGDTEGAGVLRAELTARTAPSAGLEN